MVADYDNHVIRLVKVGRVSTVTGNGEKGFTDGTGAAARFYWPYDLVVDGEDVIVVSDRYNNRLRKIVDGQVTTLGDSSERGKSDGTGAVVRFNQTYRVSLDECGRLMVTELVRKGTLRQDID